MYYMKFFVLFLMMQVVFVIVEFKIPFSQYLAAHPFVVTLPLWQHLKKILNTKQLHLELC